MQLHHLLSTEAGDETETPTCSQRPHPFGQGLGPYCLQADIATAALQCKGPCLQSARSYWLKEGAEGGRLALRMSTAAGMAARPPCTSRYTCL